MPQLSFAMYLDKIYGCFLGKTVIGTLGAPYEGVKMPLELPFRPEMIDTMLPNDDLDLQILWLDVAEKYGKNFTSDQLLERFCTHCDYSPGEYAIMRKNFMRGIHAPASGSFCNDFYTEGMGCPIRSEIWACLAPLQPEAAAELASRDGVIDHYGESVLAERFLAALESAAFGVTEDDFDLYALIETGLSVIPADCKFRRLVNDTLTLCREYEDVKDVLRRILFRYGHPDCTNMFQNMGITLTTLLKGGLDPVKTGMDALNCGFDTDCTCATAGAIIGAIRGAASLEKSFGWGDIRFVLGVTSDRRSDSVRDFSEDIALLGKNWNPDVIEGGEVRNFAFEPLPPVTAEAVYPTFPDGRPDASISLGETKQVTLRFTNRTNTDLPLTYTVEGTGCREAGSLTVKTGETVPVSVTVSIPEDAPELAETNLYTVRWAVPAPDGRSGTYRFGLCGATPWKAIGPIWRTDPVCTTEKLLKVPNYWHLIQSDGYAGDSMDLVRGFHLNFAADTDTPYLTEKECFAPLTPSGRTTYEEHLFSQVQDSFRLDDVYAMKGPTTAYLVRELVSETDETVCVQIGYSSPFALYINGQLIAERTGCATWTAENVHIQNVFIHKGVNKVVFRLTRVNEDAKYNLTFSKEVCCSEHIVKFSSVNPRFFSGKYGEMRG